MAVNFDRLPERLGRAIAVEPPGGERPHAVGLLLKKLALCSPTSQALVVDENLDREPPHTKGSFTMDEYESLKPQRADGAAASSSSSDPFITTETL
jgi:hypothetical protein